jgi:hypothetical protein
MWLISFTDNNEKRYYYIIETINLYMCYLRMGNTGKEKINQFPVYVRQYTQYTMYVYCREIYNIFVRAFETSRKASMWWSSQTCSTASTNKYLF